MNTMNTENEIDPIAHLRKFLTPYILSKLPPTLLLKVNNENKDFISEIIKNEVRLKVKENRKNFLNSIPQRVTSMFNEVRRKIDENQPDLKQLKGLNLTINITIDNHDMESIEKAELPRSLQYDGHRSKFLNKVRKEASKAAEKENKKLLQELSPKRNY